MHSKRLRKKGYKSIAVESFNNIADLSSAILINGMHIQLKRDLGREYLESSEALKALRGRIEITKSLKRLSMIKKRMVCTYDELSVNSYMNRIIKTTMKLLVRADIDKSRKKELRKLLMFFSNVDTLNPRFINWGQRYSRNNQTYQMLISICCFVIKGLIQTNSDREVRAMDFIDEQCMYRIYEKFILEYYRKEFPQIKVSAAQIPWALDDNDFNDMLPVMRGDVMLEYGDKVLIIDAKYYKNSLQKHYDRYSVHSANLY